MRPNTPYEKQGTLVCVNMLFRQSSNFNLKSNITPTCF